MTAPPPRRPWWKRTRTWAAAAVWLAISYPTGAGPVIYAIDMHWIAPDGFGSAYLNPLARLPAPVKGPLWDYISWWDQLAVRHIEAGWWDGATDDHTDPD